MKNQNAGRLTRNNHRKLEGQVKTSTSPHLRRFLRVFGVCALVGALGALASATNPGGPLAVGKVQPAPVAAPAPEPLEEVQGVAVLDQGEDAREGDSYSAFLDRQAQRRNDLAYCRQNPSDWSCTDGQYRGQY